jgi:glycosyltransferase involved in cell wall biosynthesis
MEGALRASVVVATHNRSARLVRLLDALRTQTVPLEQFEVVVVDDASTDDTAAVLAEHAARGDLRLRVLRRDRSGGPGAARNEGWRAATAPVVAFTDDDCRPAPGWLEAALAVMDAHENEVVVQGRINYDPEEEHLIGPYSRSLGVVALDGWWATANMVYPRALVEWLGGFDEVTFTGPGGEDTDLGWRATYEGVPIVFSEDALVWHCVFEVGPIGRLRFATRWAETMANFARHRELRRTNLIRGLFWKPAHYHLVRFLAALALPRPLRWAALYLGWSYYVHLSQRATSWGDGRGGGRRMIPFYALEDTVEVATVARGAMRYRTPVL